jgi:hypothetical protein
MHLRTPSQLPRSLPLGHRLFLLTMPVQALPVAATQVGVLMSDIFGPYVVTAYKVDRQLKNAGLHVFGPFPDQ